MFIVGGIGKGAYCERPGAIIPATSLKYLFLQPFYRRVSALVAKISNLLHAFIRTGDYPERETEGIGTIGY